MYLELSLSTYNLILYYWNWIMKPIDIKKTMGNMNDTIFDVFFFFTEIAKYNLNPKNSMLTFAFWINSHKLKMKDRRYSIIAVL